MKTKINKKNKFKPIASINAKCSASIIHHKNFRRDYSTSPTHCAALFTIKNVAYAIKSEKRCTFIDLEESLIKFY